MANRSYEYFPSFSPLNSEFLSGLRIIDTFSECISFNIQDKRKDIKLWAQELDDMVLESSSSPSVAIVVSDASIKNNVATSITYIYMIDKSLTKIIHYVVNVMSTEAELFTIRCGINQTLCFNNISNIIIITDFYQDRKKWTLFILFFLLIFIFPFLEQLELGLEVIGHNIGYETWENKVEGSRTNDII